jgi:hypothetical protein
MRTQSKLTSFEFTCSKPSPSSESTPSAQASPSLLLLQSPSLELVELASQHSPAPAPTSDASSCACTPLSLSSPPTRHPGGPELPQTQPGEVELGSTVHNESCKRQRHNASLSCTDLDGVSGDDSHKESGQQEGDDDQADEEEELIDSVLSTSGVDARPKVEVRGWDILQEQIKDDIVHAHKKHTRLTTINQLLLLRNFSTLRIKGVGRIAASWEIAQQWHKGKGTHFA